MTDFVVSDAYTGVERQRARDDYEGDLTNAWRDAAGEGTKPSKDALPTTDARNSAYDSYDREISEQWM